MSRKSAIGIFDSGFGGLTVFKAIQEKMPQYKYVYLGDNSRAPYGSKSFATVYKYTWECVSWLINEQNCKLIIVACNTASARALRSIQQNELLAYPDVRVLGVIRPTAEIISSLSSTKKIGIVGTEGTIKSNTYLDEIGNFSPELTAYQFACPLWVPLIEANRIQRPEAEQIIREDLESLLCQDPEIDTLLLGCTHYPLVENIIRKIVPESTRIVSQGPIVAESLLDYLQRHPEIEQDICQTNSSTFFTTDDAENFSEKATLFYQQKIRATHVNI